MYKLLHYVTSYRNYKPITLQTIYTILSKKVRVMGSGNNQITVIACASATGHITPPMVIFEAKILSENGYTMK